MVFKALGAGCGIVPSAAAVGSVLQGEEVRDAAGCAADPIQAVIAGEGLWGKESNGEGWFLFVLCLAEDFS